MKIEWLILDGSGIKHATVQKAPLCGADSGLVRYGIAAPCSDCLSILTEAMGQAFDE